MKDKFDRILGDIVTEQKLLEILNQLSNGGSALQIFITNALTDQQLYTEFISDRMMKSLGSIFIDKIRCFFSIVE